MTTSAVAVIICILCLELCKSIYQIAEQLGQLDVSITGLSLEFWKR